MKRILFTLCSFLFIASSLLSQNTPNELDVYFSNFQYQKALDYLEQQEDLSKDMLMQKAFCHKALGDYRKAIEILKPLDKEYPDNIQIKSELAVCYESIAQRQASINCYDDLIRLDSANVYFKMRKADILYQQSYYDKALALFKEVCDKEESITAMKRVGQCFERMNQLDSASIYYRRAWDENPDDGFAAASLTNVYLKQGLLTEATFCSEFFIKQDSTDAQVNLLNAICYYEMWDYDEAINRFGKCYQNGDSSFIVFKHLGIAYFMKKDYLETEHYLDKAYERDTTNNTVLYCMAESANNLGDYKKAIWAYEKLLGRIIPKDEDLNKYYDGLAQAYHTGDHYKEYVDTKVKALSYSTDSKMRGYFDIARVYDTHLKDMKNASKYYKLYRKELADYIDTLEKEEAKKEQIDDSKERLTALDEHITAIDSGATDRKLSFYGQKKPEMKMILSKSDTTGIRAFEEMIKRQKEKGDSLAITLELVD